MRHLHEGSDGRVEKARELSSNLSRLASKGIALTNPAKTLAPEAITLAS